MPETTDGVSTLPHVTRISARGRDWLAALEGGYRLSAYRDTAGVWTISAGLTFYPFSGKRVQAGDKIDLHTARLYFGAAVRQFEALVDSVTRDDLEQRELDSLVAFAFNIPRDGFRKSTALWLINTGRGSNTAGAHEALIAEAWRRWKYTHDRETGEFVVDQGLVNRRECELAVFLRGEYHDQGGQVVPDPEAQG